MLVHASLKAHARLMRHGRAALLHALDHWMMGSLLRQMTGAVQLQDAVAAVFLHQVAILMFRCCHLWRATLLLLQVCWRSHSPDSSQAAGRETRSTAEGILLEWELKSEQMHVQVFWKVLWLQSR